MGAEHNVDKGIAFAKAFRHMLLLRHAAAHGDDQRRVAALDVFQSPHIAKYPIFRVFPNGTGVKQDKISFLRGIRKRKTHFSKLSLDFLPVRHILLAAIGPHIRQRDRAPGAHLHNFCHIGQVEPLPGKLLLGKLIFQKTHSLLHRVQTVGRHPPDTTCGLV